METMAIRPPSNPLPTSTPPPTVPGPEPVPLLSHIGKSGQDALWAGFVVFLISTLVFAVMAARLHAKHRVFHYLALSITTISALSYYAMATHSGTSYVPVGWHTIQGTKTLVLRQVFWARYIDYVLTIPLVLLALALLAGLPWVNVVLLVVASEVMTLTGLFAGLHHDHKASTWGWYAMAWVLFIYIISELVWKGRESAKHQHSDISSLYTKLSIYTVVLCIVYGVVFALGQGTGIINPNGETIAFTVLDILGKTVFGIWLLVVHKHESEDAAVCLPEHWTEPRGARRGVIHLPGGDA